MARPLPVTIPVSSDIETLRKHIVIQLTNLSLRLAQQDSRTAPMSMNGNRLTEVPDPANATDAVNLRTLKKALQGVSQLHRKTQSSQGAYTIVWSINGTASGTAPPYIINPFRTGSPMLVKLYAINTGTATTGFNINYVQGGTGTAVRILSSDILLPTGTTGPITVSNFVLTQGFAVNDVLYLVVTTTGGASNLSLELLVTP